jgi:hypothetical protein
MHSHASSLTLDHTGSWVSSATLILQLTSLELRYIPMKEQELFAILEPLTALQDLGVIFSREELAEECGLNQAEIMRTLFHRLTPFAHSRGKARVLLPRLKKLSVQTILSSSNSTLTMVDVGAYLAMIISRWRPVDKLPDSEDDSTGVLSSSVAMLRSVELVCEGIEIEAKMAIFLRPLQRSWFRMRVVDKTGVLVQF